MDRGAHDLWVQAGAALADKRRGGKVVHLDFLGLLPPCDDVHVKRGGIRGSSYGLAAVRTDWWSRAVASLGCRLAAVPGADSEYMYVPYLVMHPGYAYGKLQLLARCGE